MKLFTLTAFLGISAAFVLNPSSVVSAQGTNQKISLGTIKEFTAGFSKMDPAEKMFYTIKATDAKSFFIRIEENKCTANASFVFGKVVGHEQATFFIKGDASQVNGKLIFRKSKEAYDIYTNELQEVFIAPVDINKVICVDYNRYDSDTFEDAQNNQGLNPEGTMSAPLLNSLPGAVNTIYLDFDGEVVTGSSWGNITAQPSSFTNANITTIWTAISEDYSPFLVNVTTDVAVFNAAPSNKRMKVIFTPTDDAAQGAGGVAFLNSFGSGEPCWVFNPSVKSAEEAGSHETGHTMGLNHDGTSSAEYYQGHANYGPIMGAVYTRPIVQWSKGEYTDASNTEDDLVKISSKLSYRADDHGNTTASASNLVANASGVVLASANFGVIEKRTDLDIFKFTAGNGTVNLTIMAKTEAGSASVPDLDIQARLLDASGNEIIKVNPVAVLTTSVVLTQSVSAGTYYLEIDGVGNGTGTTGYTDYGSLGQFFISGSIPAGATTDIADNTSENNISIYPNPSSGQFTITADNIIGNCSLEIMNSLGQAVMMSSETASGNFKKEINLSGVAPGIYCVTISSEGNLSQKKVLIK